jgi:hypothetical protein
MERPWNIARVNPCFRRQKHDLTGKGARANNPFQPTQKSLRAFRPAEWHLTTPERARSSPSLAASAQRARLDGRESKPRGSVSPEDAASS